MTEKPEGRLDLRSLDAAHDAAREDAVAAAVMSRIGGVIPSDVRDLQLFRRYRRRLLAAAAVLAAIATGAIAMSPRRASGSGGVDLIADWLTASHVPTNGELLAAFHGYRP